MESVDFLVELRNVPWLSVLLQVSALGAAPLLLGRGQWRRRAAILVALASLGMGWLAPPGLPLLRFTLSLGGILCFMRAIDLSMMKTGLPAARRLWQGVSPFDVDRVTTVAPHLDGRHFGLALGFALLAAAGFWLAHAQGLSPPGLTACALRWGAGVLAVYSMVEAFAALVRAGYGALGLSIPIIHRTPLFARTVQEFWGQRWNLPVHQWLRRYLFVPLARRRRPTWGVLAAFLASTAIHMWLILVPAGLTMAVVQGAFFLLQGLLLLVERRLDVARWRPLFGHAWTTLCLLLTSPLFVEPGLRAIGI